MKRLLVLAPVLFLSLVSVHAQEYPNVPGKDLFINTCGGCHGADLVIGQSNTREIWQDVVDTMRGRGATGSDDDFKVIVNYLTKAFGVDVNVNKAPAKDLVSNLEITSDEADAIVKARTAGNIKDWAALSKVPGLDIKKIEPIKARIKF